MTKTKRCESCRKRKSRSAFGKNKTKKDGLQGACKECRRARHVEEKEENNERCRKWNQDHAEEISRRGKKKYRNDPGPAKARAKKRRKEKPDQCRDENRKYHKKLKSRNPERVKFNSIKCNAKKRGILFDITYEDIVDLLLTEKCPICSIDMVASPSRNSPTNKSIDRIDASQPYTRKNCLCICYRCNRIKGDGTAEDHQRIANWMEEQSCKGQRMRMGTIIGLSGKARAGKDCVANYLTSYHGFKQTAFAESLKEACRVIFGLEDVELHGSKKDVEHEFWGMTPRSILQLVGTEAMRDGFDKNVWVKSVELRIKRSPQRWVISDTRFLEEVEAIKAWGGRVFRIDRPEMTDVIATSSHISETALDDYDGWDGVISNVGTLNELYAAAREAMGLILPVQEPLL